MRQGTPYTFKGGQTKKMLRFTHIWPPLDLFLRTSLIIHLTYIPGLPCTCTCTVQLALAGETLARYLNIVCTCTVQLALAGWMSARYLNIVCTCTVQLALAG